MFENVEHDITILKIGGSSITDKAHEETLNNDALQWFAKLVSNSVDPRFLSCSSRQSSTYSSCDDDGCNLMTNKTTKKQQQFIIVHGAGSFGHHCAKRFGLRCGKATFLEEMMDSSDRMLNWGQSIGMDPTQIQQQQQQQLQMEGLSKTRQSVQKLNAATVNCLIEHGVNAIGISPGMTFPDLRAHGATTAPTNSNCINNNICDDDSSLRAMHSLCESIDQALHVGLIPVLHGDACLLYDSQRAGILGGDTITEGLVTMWNHDNSSCCYCGTTTTTNIQRRRRRRISRVIFITDVAGIFTSDPKFDVNAQLIRYIQIDTNTGEIIAIKGRRYESDNGVMDTKTKIMNVTGSSHDHDVTGGLEVRRFCVYYTDLIHLIVVNV